MITASILLLAAACTSVPEAELRAYNEAFQAAKTAISPVLDRLAVDERELYLQAHAERLRPKPTATDRSTQVKKTNPEDWRYLSDITDPPLTASIKRALDTIDSYNNVLLALAEGRSAEEVRSLAQRFGTELGNVFDFFDIPASALVALEPITSNISERLEKTRAAEEVRRLVIQGGAEVRAILDHLSGKGLTAAYGTFATLKANELNRRPALDDTSAAQVIIEETFELRVAIANLTNIFRSVKQNLTVLEQAARDPSIVTPDRILNSATEIRTQADALRRAFAAL